MLSSIVLFLALEIGLIPNGIGIIDGSLVMPQYTLYQTVEAEMLIKQHLFVGGSTKLLLWKDRDECCFWPLGIQTVCFAGLRIVPFEVGWRYHYGGQIVPPGYNYNVFQDQSYHEVYFKMSNK